MLKTKLSLEQTWQKCMKMWKEMIEKHWKRGMRGDNLKRIYFKNHPRMKEPHAKCYFCDYVTQPNSHTDCDSCPGRLVNERFDCQNESYHYYSKPKAFYRKLGALDKKRKKV